MKFRKSILLTGALLIFANGALANTRKISNAIVTDLWVYETNDNSVHVRVHLNGSQRPGPNPAYPSNTCELRTYNGAVYSALLAAMNVGNKVEVEYEDSSNGGISCKIYAVTTSKS